MHLYMIVFCIVFLGVGVSPNLFGQTPQNTDDIETEEINIVKAFVLELEPAQKLYGDGYIDTFITRWSPSPYNIPVSLKDISYQPRPIKPLRFKSLIKDKKQATPFYLRFGFDSQLMPFGVASYTYNRSNLGAGIYYRHTSARGYKTFQDQSFSDHHTGVFIYGLFKRQKSGFSFDYSHLTDFYYGYDRARFSFNRNDIRQVAQELNAKWFLQNAETNKFRINYRQDIDAHLLLDNPNSLEYSINGQTSFTKDFNRKGIHRIGMFFDFDLNRAFIQSEITSDSLAPKRVDIKRNIFLIRPEYTFNNDDWKLVAGLSVVFENKRVRLFPLIETEKKLYKHHLIFYTGWNRQLQKNTLTSFLNANPYILNPRTLVNSRVENRKAGFKGSYKTFTYNFLFNNQVIKNMPLFVNDSIDAHRFQVIYDPSMLIFNIHLDFSYNWKNIIDIEMDNVVSIYEPTNELKAWHLPIYKMNLRLAYTFREKLTLSTTLYAHAGIFALDPISQISVPIKGTGDLNLLANYQISKHFDVFAGLNNIANQRYAYYLNYPVYGINGYVGFAFKY